MKAFIALTYAGQVKRLRRLGQTALVDFGVTAPHLKLLAHSQNTTFRVKLPNANAEAALSAPYVANQFLLRVHGSDRHGPNLATAEAIAAELAWLAALRRDTQLAEPEPVPTTSGSFITVVSDASLPQPRVCSLLRWLAGKCYFDSPRPTHLYKVGAMMAPLHDHAEGRFEVAIEQPGIVAGLEVGHGFVDDRTQLATPFEPHGADLRRRQ